jgi:hypothetical protein
MSTRSLIGVLDPDGRTFRARYCHSDGYPTYQLPALAAALHDHHDGDIDQLGQDILRYDWSFIAADEATAETADPAYRSASRPDHVVPFAGVGYRYTDSDEQPSTGTLDEHIDDRVIEWLYLFAGDQIRVLRPDEGTWVPFGEFSVIDLKAVDHADLAAREQAIYE